MLFARSVTMPTSLRTFFGWMTSWSMCQFLEGGAHARGTTKLLDVPLVQRHGESRLQPGNARVQLVALEHGQCMGGVDLRLEEKVRFRRNGQVLGGLARGGQLVEDGPFADGVLDVLLRLVPKR
jgi:hypothetical protein